MRIKKNFGHIKKPVIDGIKFDSQLEGDKYLHLKSLLFAKKIKDLKTQVPFEIRPTQKLREGCFIPSIANKNGTIQKKVYKADFTYERIEDGVKVIMDVKGRAMQVYKDKMKDIYALYSDQYDIIEVYKDRKLNNFLVF